MKPRVSDASGRTVSFADGSDLEVDAVIWATGYRPDHSWIDAPVVDDDGRVRHRRGVTDVPGLYFLGLPWQHTRGSALLGWVKDDAEFIAAEIDAARRPAEAAARHRSQSRRRSVTAVETRVTDMNPHGHEHQSTLDEQFPTDITGLPELSVLRGRRARPTVSEFDLRIAPVAKRLGDATVRMLAYNGSIPGPTLKVRQGSEVVVNVANDGDLEATVHWHGAARSRTATTARTRRRRRCRSARASPTASQFPDPGVYWYHPHIREDYGQELGLYGNILVVPADPDYWPPVNRELPLTLDDVLLEDGKIAPFSRSETTLRGDGPFRQRPARRRRARPRADRAARRGRALLPDQHRQHPRLQRRPARARG